VSAESVISVEGLSKSYSRPFGRRRVQAVKRVSLEVARGSVVAFLGPNGAGKTTTIFSLLGLVKPDRGRIRLFGLPAGSIEARKQTGFQPEIFHTYGFKTAADTLRFYGRLAGMETKSLGAAVDRQLGRLGLGAAAGRKVAGFSKGMNQRLGLAQALLHEPNLLILDEPTTGLDPEGRKLVADLILEEKARGATVFLSSHILSDVERTCDHVIILRQGEVVFSSRMTDLRKEAAVWEIDVLAWTPAARDGVDGAALVERSDGITVLRCPAADRQQVLLRLLQAGAEVGAVRQGSTLEEVYLRHAGGTSDG
jgi:ABC-2 type transport system ATP-binding protein